MPLRMLGRQRPIERLLQLGIEAGKPRAIG